MKNSRIILPLLALGVVASFYYAWQNTPRVQRVADDNARGAITADSTADMNGEHGRFDFSGGEQRKFSKPKRNLFNQLFPPPPAPKPSVVPAPIAPPAPVVVVPPEPPPVLVPVHTPSSRMPSFQVLGFLEKGARVTAFVSLQGEIYLVNKDQVFADEFRVVDLTREQLTIARISGADEVSLPLSEATGSKPISAGSATRPALRPATQPAWPDYRPAVPVVAPPFEGNVEN